MPASTNAIDAALCRAAKNEPPPAARFRRRRALPGGTAIIARAAIAADGHRPGAAGRTVYLLPHFVLDARDPKFIMMSEPVRHASR